MVRDKIVHDFAKWTAARATRGISNERAYSVLDATDFGPVLREGSGPITRTQFNCWHRIEIEKLDYLHSNIELGWIAKLVNIYLKTRCYVGQDGRVGIGEVIHPPIDNFLIKGLKRIARSSTTWDYHIVDGSGRPSRESLRRANEKRNTAREGLDSFTAIKNITTYDQYQKIIRACEAIANLEKCSLLEVEQFWEGVSR